jgi:glycosyltransferase involved in cell wall biosynthesis
MMKRKRIIVAHAQVPFFSGGAELQVNTLVAELRHRGYNAELVQIPYQWHPKERLYDNMLMWRMLDLSESNGEKTDLVIGAKFPSYGLRHANKAVWVIHQYRQAYDLYDTPHGLGSAPGGDEIRKKVMRFDEIALKEAKLLYADSKNVSERLKKYNGMDSEPLYHPPSMAGKYLCEAYEDYILSVGRLDPLKRNELFIQALAESKRPIRGKIAGAGPEMDSLQKLAKSLRVEDRVDFLGFVPDADLLKLYANAFAVFFAPVDEDYGYVTLEAFLSRKPVVTCVDSGGPLEFVRNEENGFICAAASDDIAEAIRKLSGDKALCKRFGASGYNAVKDISWDHVITKLTQTL